MTAPVLVQVTDVSKKFSRGLQQSLRHGVLDIVRQFAGSQGKQQDLREDEFWALRNVSLELRKGDALGIVGNNGAGKSTLLKLLMGRLLPTSGSITTTGRIVGITQLGLGFNPVMSGRENIYINAALLGMPRKRTDELLQRIVDFADITDFIDAPVQTYSSGMRARLGFSVAAHLDPDILLLDEVLAVGDLAFKRKCRRHVKNFLVADGTMILISHDMHAVQTLCTRCIVLDHGRILFDGTVNEGVHYYFEMQADTELDEKVVTPRRSDVTAHTAAPPPSQLQAVSAEVDAADPSGSSSDGAEHAFDVGEESFDGQPLPSTAATPLDTTASAPVAWKSPQGDLSESSSVAVLTPPRPVPKVSSEHPVVIESVEITGAQGGPLRNGQPAQIRVRYASTSEVEGIVWGFTLCTRDLSMHIASGLAGFGDAPCRLRSGRGEFSCTIPRLPLHAGTYALKAGIADADTGGAIANVGWEDAPLFFTVTGSPTKLENIHAVLGDLVSLDVQWHLPG